MTKTSSPLYLTIDQGGHASRAILFDNEGNILKRASRDINTFHPHPYHVEHNPDELIDSIFQAIEECLSEINPSDSIAAVGLATQRSSIACWNKETGEALSNVISWQDRRAAEWIERYSTQQSFIHQRTGLFPSPHYGVSKFHWCLENLPAVDKAHKNGSLMIGPLASYITHKICREHPTFADPCNGSRTLLLNLKSKRWDNNLTDLFKINQALLPTCVPNQHSFGTLSRISTKLPLTVVTGDQSAALFHDGIPNSQAIYINMGTGAFVQRLIEHPLDHSDDNPF